MTRWHVNYENAWVEADTPEEAIAAAAGSHDYELGFKVVVTAEEHALRFTIGAIAIPTRKEP